MNNFFTPHTKMAKAAFAAIAVLIVAQIVQTLLKTMSLYHFSAVCLVLSGVVAALAGGALGANKWLTGILAVLSIGFGVLKFFVVWN
ncbi:MAG: hypothetical protein RMJ87_12900 [Cytophagales bacterium]|nr:hypothetical protein [Bernardetiaceae bacterium]MDW8205920.1 hypothetical protein [Cytophagales bacterium]